MKTMSEFELNSHAEYAKKYLEHEVSFFEAMVIPPWASAFFGATNHSNEDLLNIILAYKKHGVFIDVIKKTHPIIDILLYYRLLVYKKLLLSLDLTEETRNTLQKLCYLLTELAARHSYFFADDLLSEKDMRMLLTILRLTRQLDADLADPYLRYSKVKKRLSRFYQTIFNQVLADDPNDLAFVACYINPYFQNPGGNNNKISMAAAEVFDYKKQADEWITEYSRVALVAIDRGDPKTFDVNRQAALYEAALTFDEVALAILNHPVILNFYSADEQKELQLHITNSNASGILKATKQPAEQSADTYTLTTQEQLAIKKAALQLYYFFYRLSRRWFKRKILTLTSRHLFDILTIIKNNDKEILAIIADYWHKTYRQFRIHSHSTQFRKPYRPYLNIIINFFNDKDIDEKDNIILKTFLNEFLDRCENGKATLQKSHDLNKSFRKILDHFLSIR